MLACLSSIVQIKRIKYNLESKNYQFGNTELLLEFFWQGSIWLVTKFGIISAELVFENLTNLLRKIITP